jgi:hypothetical protein
VKNSKGDYKVKIKIGDAEVDVEGAESGVVKIVEALTEVLRGPKRPTPAAQISPPSEILQSPRSKSVDIRSFFAEKKPSSDVEAAAVAAYYCKYLAPEAERRESIDSEILQDAFRLAKRPLPARTIYTLTNARNAGYLDSLNQGQFRLNPVGYNLVEHTLGASEDAEKPKEKSAKPRKKKARK